MRENWSLYAFIGLLIIIFVAAAACMQPDSGVETAGTLPMAFVPVAPILVQQHHEQAATAAIASGQRRGIIILKTPCAGIGILGLKKDCSTPGMEVARFYFEIQDVEFLPHLENLGLGFLLDILESGQILFGELDSLLFSLYLDLALIDGLLLEVNFPLGF